MEYVTSHDDVLQESKFNDPTGSWKLSSETYLINVYLGRNMPDMGKN
jgi:hypothetical protein